MAHVGAAAPYDFRPGRHGRAGWHMRQPRQSAGAAVARELLSKPFGMESRRTLPRSIVLSILLLLLTIVGFWGYVRRDADAQRIAHIMRTRAVLNDATCTFAAAVTLLPDADEWAFERHQPEVRQALVALLKTKSRYMVSNPTAREALRIQMLREVNRVMARPTAEHLKFTEFVLS